MGEAKHPPDLFGRGGAVLVRYVKPGSEGLADASSLEGESSDVDLVGEIDDIGLPFRLIEAGVICHAVWASFSRSRFDFDDIDDRPADPDHVRTGHQAVMRKGRLMQQAVSRLDPGNRPCARGRMGLLRHVHVLAGMVDPYQLLEHVAALGQHAHILVPARAARQSQLGQRILDPQRALQSQLKKGLGQGRGRHEW